MSKTYKGHKVSEIEVSPATNYTRTQGNNPQGTYTPARDTLTITLTELTNEVKPKNVSKTIDENGEPLATGRLNLPLKITEMTNISKAIPFLSLHSMTMLTVMQCAGNTKGQTSGLKLLTENPQTSMSSNGFKSEHRISSDGCE